MTDLIYLICDGDGTVVRLSEIDIFGRSCSLPAIFIDEGEALHVLWELEHRHLGEVKYRIKAMNGRFQGVAR